MDESIKTKWIKLEDAKAAVDAVSVDIGGESSPSYSFQNIKKIAGQQVLDAAKADIKNRLENIEDTIELGFDLVRGNVVMDPDAAAEDEP